MEEKGKLKFLNTLGRKLEDFKPINPEEVTLYTCGPTVYARAHIGNLRAYVFGDVLKRTLEYAGYNVKHVMNITDVGHLTSDADEGEDKMQKAAKQKGITSLAIAEEYTRLFFQDIDKLNIKKAKIICKATEHIKEQIELVRTLEEKGDTYRTSDGIYFDTSKFPNYADLAKLNIEGLGAGKRISMGEKKNKTDFALWKFSKEGEQRDLEWDSPWGTGFPGWHLECSAMCLKYLGETIDIHTGGIDHIPVHHTNEIAQSESATGKKFANYWLHSDFLIASNEEKMGKSKGNIINLDQLENEGINPLVYRYLCLNSHYRKQLVYSLEVFEGTKNAYKHLKTKVEELNAKKIDLLRIDELSKEAKDFRNQFREAVFNDLNTPQGLAILWDVLKNSELSTREKYFLANDFDKVLALGISSMEPSSIEISDELQDLLIQREAARNSKNWNEADIIRDRLLEKGYKILDTKEGSKLKKI